MSQFGDTVMDIRDKIQSVFSTAQSITGKTTRFPVDGSYCFLNHPNMRDNFADLLIVAQDTDLRYRDSHSLRDKLLKSLNELSKVVYSLDESTRTMYGIFDRETFESTFKLTWNSQKEQQMGENGCLCKDCSSDCSDCGLHCLCVSLNVLDVKKTGCNDDGCKCTAAS